MRPPYVIKILFRIQLYNGTKYRSMGSIRFCFLFFGYLVYNVSLSEETAMLGYVTCEKAELKMKDYECYSGYYCGICKSIGARYGQIPRGLLSYDAAFAALLLASLYEPGEDYRVSRNHCIAHPVMKKTVVEEKAVDYGADIMLLLAYYKAEDDVRDEGGAKARAVMTALKRPMVKLQKTHPALCDIIGEQVRIQSELEARHCPSVDEAADPTGRMLAAILTGDRHHEEAEERILLRLGYQMGRWVYLIDAADDLPEDIEEGNYNPFLERFGYEDTMDKEEFAKSIRDHVERILVSCLSDMSRSAGLLAIKRHNDIINNVLYLGLLRQTDKVLAKLAGEPEEQTNEM